jgi:hypothetical protein
MRRGSQDEEEKRQRESGNVHDGFSGTIAALIRGVLSSQKSGFAPSE